MRQRLCTLAFALFVVTAAGWTAAAQSVDQRVGVAHLAGSNTLIRVTVEALPDERMRRAEARRASSRRLARRFALRAIDAFVDRALARHALDLSRHAAVRHAIAESAVVVGSEPLIDHGARLTVQVPIEVILRVSGLSGVEWVR